MERRVEPEILDGLPPDDPEAVRSRTDLRRINFLMGNEAWIEARVAALPEACASGIVEIGAGEGRLAARLSWWGRVTAVDLTPRPADLDPAIDWRQGDVFAMADDLRGGVLVANLFLHHFGAEALVRLGRLARRFEHLVVVEPLRTGGSLALGRLMLPFVNRVTRHDMQVSIRAGFVTGEITRLLGLEHWDVREQQTLRGGIRLRAGRRSGGPGRPSQSIL